MFTFFTVKITQKNKLFFFPVFLLWIFFNPITTMLSLQFNTIWMILLLAMLLILYKNERWKERTIYVWGLFFAIIGAITSYMDLLTYPLVTLGIPLSLWMELNYLESLKENLKRIVYLSVFWTVGYGFMWGSKWILGSIVTGEDIMENAVAAISFRISSNYNEETFHYLDILFRQLKASFQLVWLFVIVVTGLLLLIKAIIIRKSMLYVLVPYMAIAIYPLSWYLVLKNHSYIHYWFTYRELGISLYAFTTFAMIYIGGGVEA